MKGRRKRNGRIGGGAWKFPTWIWGKKWSLSHWSQSLEISCKFYLELLKIILLSKAIRISHFFWKTTHCIHVQIRCCCFTNPSIFISSTFFCELSKSHRFETIIYHLAFAFIQLVLSVFLFFSLMFLHQKKKKEKQKNRNSIYSFICKETYL